MEIISYMLQIIEIKKHHAAEGQGRKLKIWIHFFILKVDEAVDIIIPNDST